MAGRTYRIGAVCLAVFVTVGVVLGQSSAGAATERIKNFASHIVVNPDASVTVTEKITVNSAGQEIKRGIVRDFPTSYKNRHGHTVKVGFEIGEILKDGRPEPYHVERAANGVRIFIGQKEVFLSPGQYTYTITYTTDRQLGYFTDYDELYWNVTGNGWIFPIDKAQAVVQLPAGAGIKQYAAYTGRFGEQGQDFRVSYDRAGRIVFTTTRGLDASEGLTIAVAWPKGIVREPTDSEKAWSFFQDNASLAAAFLGLLILLGYYLLIWNRVGRDPEKGAIIPLFEPPPGFSPAAVRYLSEMGFDAKAFAAAVINMAVRGFLRMHEADGVFQLEKKKGGAQLSPEEEILGRDLFVGHQIVDLDQSNQKTIARAQESFKAALHKMLQEHYFKTNRVYLWPALIITGLTLAGMIVMAEEPAAAAGSTVFYLVTGIAFAAFYQQWQGSHWLRKIFLGFFGLFWAFFSLILGPAAIFGSVLAPVAFVGILIVHLLFLHLLKAPTLRGRQVLDQIEGFKMYLAVAEKDRLEVLHPPEKTPELYERYLPYALALDVENEWSEQFAEVLEQAAEKPYQPSWYRGGSWDSRNLSGFSASLGSSLSSAIAAAATPPSSSSGSGGGGSSGGGGGGGGGGGW